MRKLKLFNRPNPIPASLATPERLFPFDGTVGASEPTIVISYRAWQAAFRRNIDGSSHEFIFLPPARGGTVSEFSKNAAVVSPRRAVGKTEETFAACQTLGAWRVVTIVVIASLDRFQTQPIREIRVDRATVTSGVCGSMVAAAA